MSNVFEFSCFDSRKTESCWRKLGRTVKADQSKYGSWSRRYFSTFN